MDLPDFIENAIKKLQQNGYEAYVVGGCVRDSLLGRIPNDWDIATSALPVEVKLLFPDSRDTGVRFGTVTIGRGRHKAEVTTFREEGEYLDFRRPSVLRFGNSLAEDLKRRDFTVNSIAYNPERGYIDPFSGMEDVKKQLIRCTGSPRERLCEDPLRMLRAVRFSSQLGFVIEEDTFRALQENAFLIEKISGERIREELEKILMSDDPEKLLLLQGAGLLVYILPEFARCIGFSQNNPLHTYDVGMHSLKAVKFIENDPVLRWTMLLHDTGKFESRAVDEKGRDHFHGHEIYSIKAARLISQRLKFSSKEISIISKLIKWHDVQIGMSPADVRRAASKIGVKDFFSLLKVKKADKKAQNPKYAEEELKALEILTGIFNGILDRKEPLAIKDLAVNGCDLKDKGMKQDRQIGAVLGHLLEIVLTNPEYNTREKLLMLVEKQITPLREPGENLTPPGQGSC